MFVTVTPWLNARLRAEFYLSHLSNFWGQPQIMAAEIVAGYIQGLLDGVEFKRNSYAFDRASRQAALGRLFDQPKKEQADAEKQSVD